MGTLWPIGKLVRARIRVNSGPGNKLVQVIARLAVQATLVEVVEAAPAAEQAIQEQTEVGAPVAAGIAWVTEAYLQVQVADQGAVGSVALRVE